MELSQGTSQRRVPPRSSEFQFPELGQVPQEILEGDPPKLPGGGEGKGLLWNTLRPPSFWTQRAHRGTWLTRAVPVGVSSETQGRGGSKDQLQPAPASPWEEGSAHLQRGKWRLSKWFSGKDSNCNLKMNARGLVEPPPSEPARRAL